MEFITSLFVPSDSYFVDKVGEFVAKIKNKYPNVDIGKLEDLAVGEKKFQDIYANFFGMNCLVVRASVVNNIISWARPIIQGLIALFLLLFNYNQLYKLIRGGNLVSAQNTINNISRK